LNELKQEAAFIFLKLLNDPNAVSVMEFERFKRIVAGLDVQDNLVTDEAMVETQFLPMS
jgi:hypothetical protein